VTNGKWYWEHSSFSGRTLFLAYRNSSGTTTQAYEQAYTVGLFMNANSDIYFYDPSGRTESFSFTFATTDVMGDSFRFRWQYYFFLQKWLNSK
jgi:hypothetical protein